MSEPTVTDDALFGGRLKLTQPARGSGYRTNIDAILLAAFAERSPARAKLAVDLGAGAGAVGLSALYLGVAERMVFVEREPRMVELCAANLAVNAMSAAARVVAGDLDTPLTTLDASLHHACDLVLANPPYFPPQSDTRAATGTNPRAKARHGELGPFLRAAAEAMGRRGRACFVYPSDALVELLSQARQLRLEPKRLRLVHGKADRPARIALLEMAGGKPGGLVILPPLIETQRDGQRVREISELLNRQRFVAA